MVSIHRSEQAFGPVPIARRHIFGAVAAALVALAAHSTHAQEAAATSVSAPAAEPDPAAPAKGAATAAAPLPPAPPPLPAPWVYYPPTPPVDTRPFVPASAAEIPPDDEGRYEPPSVKSARRLRRIGGVFMGFGLGSALVGGLAVGVGASVDQHTRQQRETSETFTRAGVSGLVVGGIMMLVGVPLFAVGTAKLP